MYVTSRLSHIHILHIRWRKFTIPLWSIYALLRLYAVWIQLDLLSGIGCLPKLHISKWYHIARNIW